MAKTIRCKGNEWMFKNDWFYRSDLKVVDGVLCWFSEGVNGYVSIYPKKYQNLTPKQYSVLAWNRFSSDSANRVSLTSCRRFLNQQYRTRQKQKIRNAMLSGDLENIIFDPHRHTVWWEFY